jgi:predicted ATPase
MISKWKLFNFKSVGRETPLDLQPLTIFAGPNSSGKSTFIQSILLICQTLRNPIGSRSVILNGQLTRLGQFSDLRTVGADANQIVIGWELKPNVTSRVPLADSVGVWDEDWLTYEVEDAALLSVECNVGFDAKLDVPNDTSQLIPQLFSTELRVKTRDSDGADQLFPLLISRMPDGGENKQVTLRALGLVENEIDRVRSSIGFNVEMDAESAEGLKRRFSSAEVIGCDLTHFLPQRVAVSYNRLEEQVHVATHEIFGTARIPVQRRGLARDLEISTDALTVLRNALDAQLGEALRDTKFGAMLHVERQPVGLTLLVDALRDLRPIIRRQVHELLQNEPGCADEFGAAIRAKLPSEYRTAFVPPPRGVQTACQYMRRYFSQSVRYLGPLRDEPKAIYPLSSGTDPFDVGLKGENTAAVLDLHKIRPIRLIPPAAFARPAISVEPVTRTLQAAVTEWLRYLGVADSVESRDRGKLGHELKVTINEGANEQDLTHVGVGVSQVLPILVMCLIADRDNVLLFEQPELHLHPKVQTLLGDFFLSMALMDKQCLIETHSEYLINRLRFRAAAANADEVTKRMTIYFVEKKKNRSEFRPVVVNEFGAIPDWPDGFFDQSQDEAEQIIREATRKRLALEGRLPRAGRND